MPVSVIQLVLWLIRVQPASFNKLVREYPQNQHLKTNSYQLCHQKCLCVCVVCHSQMLCTRNHDATSTTHFLVNIWHIFQKKKYLSQQKLNGICWFWHDQQGPHWLCWGAHRGPTGPTRLSCKISGISRWLKRLWVSASGKENLTY